MCITIMCIINSCLSLYYYFAPKKSAKYYDERVCVSLCNCACVSWLAYLKNHAAEFHQFFSRVLPEAMAWMSSCGVAICYVLPVLWMTSCFHIMVFT